MASTGGSPIGKRAETETAAELHEHPAWRIKTRDRNGFYNTTTSGCGLKQHEELEMTSTTREQAQGKLRCTIRKQKHSAVLLQWATTVDASFLGHSA